MGKFGSPLTSKMGDWHETNFGMISMMLEGAVLWLETRPDSSASLHLDRFVPVVSFAEKASLCWRTPRISALFV
jgi:hypothetical protein